jgi:nitroreductase
MKEKVLQALTTRRSVRSYQKTQVDEQALQEILEAGKYAATGRGRQSPIMLVVQNDEMREQLRRMNAEIMGTPDADPFYGAPTIIIVLADRSVPTCVEDGSLVLGNLMNAAHAVGVDSCWIHRARQEFESEEGKALLRRLGIEGDYIGVGHLILGYRDGELPSPKPRKQNYVYRL